MKKRRTLIRLLVCLMLGAATSIGVAWSIKAPLVLGALPLPNFTSGPVSEAQWERWVPDTWPEEPTHEARGSVLGFTGIEQWIDADLTDQVSVEPWLMIRRFGWPARALVLVRTRVRGPGQLQQDLIRPGLVGQLDAGLRLPLVGRLPVVPEWPGLLLDTLFYAALWVSLTYTVRILIRARRRRRGRCLACGYDLAGLAKGVVCPECGGSTSKQRVVDSTIAKGG